MCGRSEQQTASVLWESRGEVSVGTGLRAADPELLIDLALMREPLGRPVLPSGM
jgi:hypothetical protein